MSLAAGHFSLELSRRLFNYLSQGRMLNFTLLKNLCFAFLCCMLFVPAALACTELVKKTAYKSLYIVYKDRKVGYIDAAGKLVIKASYNRATNFKDGFAIVSHTGGKQFFIDMTGRKLAAPAFEEAWLFTDGLAGVKIKGKWGFIDRNGKLVIPAKFDSADGFCGGRAVVGMRTGETLKFGFIDKAGKYTLEPSINYITAFADGLAKFSNNAKFIQRPTYFVVDGGALYGLIDPTGKIMVEPKFDSISYFHEGLAEAVSGGRKGFIDTTGKWLEGFDGYVTRWFSEGLAAAYMAGKGYGYVDKNAKFVIGPQFREGKEFSGGLAPVKTEKGWGYIDKTGKMVIPEKFSGADPFFGPVAQVTITSGKVDPKDNFPEILFGYIDRTGKYVWEPST
jgi:hypothetical protein